MQIIDAKENSEQEIERAAEIINRGGLLAFPTETVFGLGASIDNHDAIKKIYEVKGRSFQKPLSIHAANIEIAKKYVKEIPEEAQKLIERFIPGPLMLVLEKNDNVPDIVTGGSRKIGIRIPSNETFTTLAQNCKSTIVATSANRSGHFSPVNKDHVISDLGDYIDGILVDDENMPLGIESTVIDFTVKPFVVLRSGFVRYDEILDIIGGNLLFSGDSDLSGVKRAKSDMKIIVLESTKEKILPVMKNMYLKFNAELAGKVGVLVTDGSAEVLMGVSNIKVMGSRNEPEIISRNFFSCLRAFEKEEIEIIIVEGISREGVGWAVMDRLCGMASEVIKL